MNAHRRKVTVGSRLCEPRGLVAVVACLAPFGCMFIEDPGETHPPLDIEPEVRLFDYSLRVADSGEVLASGCGASRGGIEYEEELTIAVPLEQELVYEERLVGSYEGSFSGDKDQNYYCGLGPTEIGVGSQLRANPKCFVVEDPGVFEVLSYELIGYQGESVDWESSDDDLIASVGLRSHLIQHDYGIVGVRLDPPLCERGWSRFYTAIAPEEEEE